MGIKCMAVCDKCEWEAKIEFPLRRNPIGHAANLPNGWMRIHLGTYETVPLLVTLCPDCPKTEQERMLKKMSR